MKPEHELILEFLCWGVQVFTRRDLGLTLSGYRPTATDRRIDELLERLRQQRLLEKEGRGRYARFTITAAGQQQVRTFDPAAHWNQPWDAKWRVFTFDFPANRHKDRILLWRALRNHKFGLLQRSVWIWPHMVTSILEGIVQAQGIPECFCGFEAGHVFLCDNAEIIVAAWDFEEIARRHSTYLNNGVATTGNLARARDLRELARLTRIERDAFHYAFSRDPLLPRELWPKGYKGPALHERRLAFHAQLRRRLREFANV